MRIIIIFALIGGLMSCKNSNEVNEILDAQSIHDFNRSLIEISMEDIYSPPVATRVFAYPNLIAYDVYMHGKGESVLSKVTNGTVAPVFSDTLNIDYSYASMEAFYLMSKKLVFSEHLADKMIENLRLKVDSLGMNSSRKANSIKYAETIGSQMSEWIGEDGYAQVKADDFYTIRGHDSTWVLTPPNYEPALEPNWKNLRPIFLDNVENFQPIARPPFSTDKNSVFYKEALKVYEQFSKNSDDSRSVAKHWDCNPNEFIQKGHTMEFNHRISPPGHWLGIAKSLADIKDVDLEMALKSYAMITTAMFDGVIACWHTKYTEELIRPVTYINRYIDENWQPYIQTPPFPEYTSGHSVVSGCSSSILDALYPNTPFVDYTEVEFGLPSRSFKSVHDAGEEASISRYYGGIHYQYGVDNGLIQGRKIGNHILTQFSFDE
jgi:hypothetical protein